MPVTVYQKLAIFIYCTALLCRPMYAQSVGAGEAEGAKPVEGMVTLNLPENVNLKTLVEYVGLRQGINFIYDTGLANHTITIKAPKAIPSDALMKLLESVLKSNNYVVMPSEIAGTMRIVQTTQLVAVAGPLRGVEGPAGPVRAEMVSTRMFELKHANHERVSQIVTPFLTAGLSNLVSVPEHNLLIITDYSTNMKRVEDLIAVVDRPAKEVDIRFVPIRQMEAAAVAQQVTQLLAGKAKAAGQVQNAGVAVATIIADQRANQVAIVGRPEQIKEVHDLVKSLDDSLGMTTKVYTFKVVSSEQIDRLMKKLVGEVAAKRFYKSATDREMNLLIAAATPEIHKQIESLRESMDKPTTDAQSPIRFYKLQNAKAGEVLDTLQSIEGDRGLENVSVDGVAAEGAAKGDDYSAINRPGEANENGGGLMDGTDVVEAAGSANGRSKRSVQLRNARVMADEPSNTLIVVASPSMQGVYQKLIERLDVRRPQVLIEATVVSIDTTDGFQLGVEISKSGSLKGEGKTINFSSFGLSTVDGSTGGLTLKPGLGFNGAVITTDIANIIIRALESDDRVKVVSRPSVLINDNAKGMLDSVSKVPFASVNASSTVATTSLGGYAEAGTKINITPQISEGDHLKLTYSIELSSFGDTTTDGLPPSQLKNSLESEVTIPDGFTIVVGGLKQDRLTESVDRVPLLGRIPVLEYLFSNRTKETRQSTLFVFIHAVVLRDDKFADLKILSSESAIQAELATGFPTSDPVEIK